MRGDGNMITLVMVKEHRDRTYEVRLALYRSGGVLVREEAYLGVRSVNIDANMDIVKIGCGELHLISREEVVLIMGRDKDVINIVGKSSHTASE